MINNIFNDDSIKKLKGNLGIGHTRYSTAAASEEVNCQPFVVHTAHGALALAHNGELINCESLRKNVLERGQLRKSKAEDAVADGWVISSESCGFLSIGARYVREVEPGEIVELTKHGVRTVDKAEMAEQKRRAFCIFEYVYFARSDSIFEGQMVYSVRSQCGRQLAREALVDADIVSPVPESGTAAAHGYARESGLNFAEVLCKNRYVGRTFIQPSTRLRQLGVAKKFGALSENVANKRFVLIDDSIVRGNTIGPIIKLLREGALKVAT